MNKEVYYNLVNNYLSLISAYLNKKEVKDFKIDESNISFFLKFSKKHNLTALFYKVVKDTKVDIPKEYLDKLEEYYLVNLRKSLSFEKERKDLYRFLNENQIDFLPLKGIIIKDYYPDPNSREFADNDILFGSKDKAIRDYFISKGYKVEMFRKYNHDTYLKKPFYNFEMHRALFTAREDILKFVKYFEDFLSKAKVKKDYEHESSKEDFYIYFTAHSFKHFNTSGCGVRTLIDYYLYLKNNTLDFDYINQELEKLDLLDFSNSIINLSNKVFDNKELNEEEKEMLIFIASSGTYGTLEHSVSRGVKEKGKFRYLMSRVFPPIAFYKTSYPWAYKTKILIPVAWLFRLFRIIFTNPKKATNEIKLINKQKKNK